jgi:hypothetical protein
VCNKLIYKNELLDGSNAGGGGQFDDFDNIVTTINNGGI